MKELGSSTLVEVSFHTLHFKITSCSICHYFAEIGLDLEVNEVMRYLDTDYHACQIISNHPVPAGINTFYFEVSIDPSIGKNSVCELAIGFTTHPSRLDNYLPGWWSIGSVSWAFHRDVGGFSTNNRKISEAFRDHTFSKGNTIGCGIIYDAAGVGIEGKIFYTKDGKALGVGFDSGVIGRLYPTIGIFVAIKCTVNWGPDSAAGKAFL